MSTDYLALLREKNAETLGGGTDKTDTTPAPDSSVSFVSSPLGKFQKNNVMEPLPVTREWLESQGCRNVLPLDVAHIKKHLPQGTAARNRVLLAYVDSWLQAAETEPVQHRKDNAGRRAANAAIRESRL